MSLLQEYKAHEAQRQSEGGLPGLALTAAQTADLVEILKASKVEDAEYALNLFKNKINPGVDDAAYVKAAFLNGFATVYFTKAKPYSALACSCRSCSL